MANTSLYLLIILVALAQVIYSQPKIRFNCEPCSLKLQHFNVYCPTYGSCQWYCQEKLANCIPGTRYHCARSFHDKDRFIDACVPEVYCTEGEEPRLSINRTSSHVDQAIVPIHCRPCFKRDRFNDRLNTSSATYSECPSLKTNLCTEQQHKVDCGNVSHRELTKTDGHCRCDARNGYAAQSEEMCFYENKKCFKKKCPDGEELLLNYSCAKECPAGLARQKTSDTCQHVIILPPATTSVFTTAGNDNAQHLSTENPDHPPRVNKIIPALIVTAVLVFIGIVFLVVCKHKLGRQPSNRSLKLQRRNVPPGWKLILSTRILNTDIGLQIMEADEKVPKESNQDIPPEEQMSLVEAARHSETDVDTGTNVTNTPKTKILQAVSPVEREGATRSTVTTIAETHDDQVQSSESAPLESEKDGSLGEKWCMDVYKSMLQKGFIFPCGFEYDNLKERNVMEPTSWPTLYARIDVQGLQPYAIPGEKTTSLYLLISHLLCGNEDLTETLRFAAARLAINNFETYVKQLMVEFRKSETPLIDAHIFFEIHGVYVKEFTFPLKEASVKLALDDLVRGILVTERSGPLHAEFLGSVLNCNIIQHFENGRYNDRDVRTMPGLSIALKSRTSHNRELHIYWMKSTKYSHSYCIIPLFKEDDQTSPKKANVSQVPKFEMDNFKAIMEKIAEQESYKWRTGLKIFERSKSAGFDKLKDMEFIKPDRIVRTIDVPGYKAYEKPGDEITSVYEWISHLLCGDESLKYILRLAAARYAMKHFQTYVTKLTYKFNDFYEAKVFFAAHDITVEDKKPKSWRKNKREWVSDRFDKLVRETVNEGKGSAPLYVEFLSGVLNRKITQHFEENTYSGRKVNTFAGLDVTLTTESSSSREMHMYWMRSERNSHQIVPLFKCVPSSTGMELCGDVYTLLKNQELFKPNICLDMIHKTDIYAFEQLKGHAIIKPDPNVLRIIQILNRINVQGYTAYEKPGHETTCLYELMSYLLFGNADMTYILRLAALRYALQNVGKYVEKLIDEFEDTLLSRTKVNNAKTFFEIHNIEFKESKQSLMGKGVRMAFADLLSETVNTGQGPFYVEFLSGALNCKITQSFDEGFYNRDVNSIRGLNVTLTTSTPPERELRIYRMKTSKGRSNTYKILPLFKSDC